MSEKKYNPIKWNKDVIATFSEKYYGSLLTKANLSEEVVIDEKPFWQLNKNKRKYLINHEVEDILPIIPSKITKIHHRNKLYHFVKAYKIAKFKSEKNHTFRNLVDEFMSIKHSNETDYLLYKLVVLTAYLERINYRCATEASFGKGVPVNCLQHLRKDTTIFNPASMAAVEYRLTNKFMVLDEISNLEASQKRLIQEFLLLAGDFKNIYEKSTRGTAKYGTSDEYKISNLSIGIIYNILDHYEKSGQSDKYFDKVFQKAVLDRFLPLKLSGTIDVKQFSVVFDKERESQRHTDYYVSFIRSLEYYKNNYLEELKQRKIIEGNRFKYPLPSLKGLLSGRQELSFNKVARFIALYSKDEDEYTTLVQNLVKAIRNYYIMLRGGNATLVSEQVVDTSFKKPKELKVDETEEELIVEEEKIITTPEQEKELEKNNVFEKQKDIKEEIKLYFEGANDNDGKGVDALMFTKIFGEEKVKKLKEEGYIFEQHPGFFKRI